MPIWLILTATALYMLGLFAIAWRGDREAARPGVSRHPLVYALALAVYCTSWTYFGAVGTAAAQGWDYLPIYLGPALVFLLWSGVVRRIGDVAQRESISSLSDFLSARYGKSRAVGAVATLAAVTGCLPYIALQLKSVGMSFQALASGPAGTASRPADETVLLTAVALAVFAILFGTRHSDATRPNTGLLHALAVEAILKLIALVAVCGLSIALVTEPGVALSPAARGAFETGGISGRFITITLLSMAAIICLPRQFHVAVIERREASEVGIARWVFPAYLAATSFVVVPITLAGLTVLAPGTPPDLFVLDLPLSQGDGLLAMFVFLGGFSAATGMVIVSTIALSTMVTNDLVVPTIMHSGRFSSLSGNSGARLVIIRRIVIVVLLLLAYGYYRIANSSEALAQIGLLSFAAAVQFAPALIGAIYWRGGRRTGALAGLVIGMLAWGYTLFLPAILTPAAISAAVPPALNPHALFGVSFGDGLTHGVIWSLGLNLVAFVAGSAWARERLRDRVQAAAFVGDPDIDVMAESPSGAQVTGVSPNGLKTLASRFLAPEAVDHAFDAFEKSTGVTASGDAAADWRLVQRTERLLASALGASSARVVLSSAIGGSNVALPDVLSMLDHKTQAERFERHMLQSMLENISQGISMVDADQRLVAWNSAYLDLFDYPKELVSIGRPVSDLIAHNLRSGWIDGDPVEEARRRVEYMRAGRPHSYERQNPNGRYLRIVGNPMPGGGYVTTFTDITQDKRREQALVESNETLEQRVRERTHDLEKMAGALDLARQEAEGANASKTRFLAAASHDLLQPLNAARLYLGTMKSVGSAPELVSKTDRAIQSADELLKGLLDISRLDHGNISPEPAIMPVGPLLEDFIDEAAPMAEQAGIDIRIAPTRLAVRADPEFLKSILRNFLSNARRYTRSGRILVGARRRGDCVRIEVWDTGPGIAADRTDLIFEEFRRFEDVDNVGIRGAGLGLSVVRRLADLMGAEVTVRSRHGKGSVFAVSVPRVQTRPAPVRPVPPEVPVPASDLTGLRVLCVDDEAVILDGMSSLLSGWGCEVTGVRSGAAARSAIMEHTFDALIADLQLLDDMTGLDLIAECRHRLTAPGNVLLLTATATDTIRRKAMSMGVKVVRKPSDPDSIRGFLEACKLSGAPQAAE